MATILDTIMAKKRREVPLAKAALPEEALRAALASCPPVRDFLGALSTGGSIKLIAEVKKASPSASVIREDFDPVAIAKTYEAHGATCISVLTDVSFFQGKLEYLSQVKQATGLPVLRKDFVYDAYQILEARVAGADAVLLIAECLEPAQLKELVAETHALGMTPLVELYDPANLPSVLDSGAKLIGVNSRNLHTMEVDLNHTLEIRKQVPENRVFVGESGIRNREDVVRLEAAGVDAILVGESLMRQADIGAAVNALMIETD